jgi:hypothetical protein
MFFLNGSPKSVPLPSRTFTSYLTFDERACQLPPLLLILYLTNFERNGRTYGEEAPATRKDEDGLRPFMICQSVCSRSGVIPAPLETDEGPIDQVTHRLPNCCGIKFHGPGSSRLRTQG